MHQVTKFQQNQKNAQLSYCDSTTFWDGSHGSRSPYWIVILPCRISHESILMVWMSSQNLTVMCFVVFIYCNVSMIGKSLSGPVLRDPISQVALGVGGPNNTKFWEYR